MRLSEGEKVSHGVKYEMELSRALEVAEYGEYAQKERYQLPYNFDIEDVEDKKALMKMAKKKMVEKGFDTMVIKKETYEEFVYYKEEEE